MAFVLPALESLETIATVVEGATEGATALGETATASGSADAGIATNVINLAKSNPKTLATGVASTISGGYGAYQANRLANAQIEKDDADTALDQQRLAEYNNLDSNVKTANSLTPNFNNTGVNTYGQPNTTVPIASNSIYPISSALPTAPSLNTQTVVASYTDTFS